MVVKNRWRERFDGIVEPDWSPTRSVSVVIPVHDTPTLPLTLASLAAQDYPDHLLEVVVVDDGSKIPVDLGPIVPPNCRVVRGPGWGRSAAAHYGALDSSGDVIYWVDADMILFRDNVREHAKWSHFVPEAATIGHKGFVDRWSHTPEEIMRRVRDGSIAGAHPEADEHWIEEIFRRTDDLNASDGRNYSTFTGASASVPRELYLRSGGLDPSLKLGEDTEFGYRLWQAGGVFIPARGARAWHLGRSTMQQQAERVKRVNDVAFAQRMPIPRYRRRAAARVWQVPLVHAVVEVDATTAAYARACVDRILASTLTDVHVSLVGAWSSLRDERRSVLDDPVLELRLTREWFRSDSRVRFVESVPESVFPAPYRLDLPPSAGLEVAALERMWRTIDDRRVARLEVVGPAGRETAVMWDCAAVARARGWTGGGSWQDWLDDSWGVAVLRTDEVGVVDLADADLEAPVSNEQPEIAELRAKVDWLRGRAERAEAALSAHAASEPAPHAQTLRARVSASLRRTQPRR